MGTFATCMLKIEWGNNSTAIKFNGHSHTVIPMPYTFSILIFDCVLETNINIMQPSKD